MVVRLVCGYMGHGKDTLWSDFQDPSLFADRWMVLRNPSINNVFVVEPVARLAFADNLKLSFIADSNLDLSLDEFNQIKDQATDNGWTWREHLIRYSQQFPPGHWTRNILPSITDGVMITDFRQEQEWEHISLLWSVVTIRVFRTAAPIPDIPSEHYLDRFSTDFVVLPRQQWNLEYQGLIEILPHYQGYLPCPILLQE